MKYREDMMEDAAECPGMRSDRPGITPNDLVLESSSLVLEREKEWWREAFGRV